MGLSESWFKTLLNPKLPQYASSGSWEKAGGPAADAMRGIVINLFSEAIKKMVF